MMKNNRPIVSIQGIQGSFHDLAKNHLYGSKAKIIGRDSFVEIFEDLAQKKADLGIIAIENSLVGPILENYDHLENFKVFITKELFLKISHHLISFPNTNLKDVKEIHAHPMALAQCQKFLLKNPQIKQVNNPDTAAAVQMIKTKNLKQAAAIASKQAARIFQMKVIKSHLEDQPNNFTRFLIVSTKKEFDKKANKTTLLVQIPNQPCSLHKTLSCFADQSINLINLESRPILDKAWHYSFFLDLEIGAHEPRFKKALTKLKTFAWKVKILGSYQKGEYLKS